MKALSSAIFLSLLRGAPLVTTESAQEDLLDISVYEDEKLNKTVRVSSQGDISLPSSEY